MSSDFTKFTAVLEPLHHSVSDFRTGCSELEEVLDDMFQEMDRLRVDLVSRVAQLDQKQAHLEDQQQQLAEQNQEITRLKDELSQRDIQMVEARQEWAESSTDLALQIEQAEQAANEELDQLKRQLESTQQEREQLGKTVKEHAGTESRVAELEAELADTKQRLADAQEQAAQALPTAEAPDDSGSLVALTHERDALEEELELVRGRASELSETVAAQQMQLSEQTVDSSDELSQLRRLVEKQAELISDRTVPQVAEPEQPAASDSTENEAVVNSVMAQFAKLHKNVSQRRQHSK